jgi:hypothetical protein
MKTTLLLLVIPLVLFFASCTEEDKALIPTDSVEATIAGTGFSSNFTSTSVGKNYSSTTAPIQFTITGNAASGGEYIVLAIKNFNKSNPNGTYSIGTATTSAAIAAYHRPNSSADEIATSGQITITGYDGLSFAGTFNFTTNASQVTNGKLVIFP